MTTVAEEEINDRTSTFFDDEDLKSTHDKLISKAESPFKF